MSPELSVVIGTYNRPHLLENTLKALRSQQAPASLQWEIIVVDNNSRDKSRQVVHELSRTAGVPVHYAFEPRQGLSHARNRGIQQAHGSIIAFTDDDVIPAPDWVAGVHRAIVQWPADGVGGRILPRWETAPPQWLIENPRLLARLAVMDFEESCFLKYPMHGSPQIWGANMAFRREVFDKVGIFDPRRGMMGNKFFRGEEVDLVNRALERGLRIVYDATLTVFHRIGPDRMRKAYFRKLFFDMAQGETALLSSPQGRRFLGAPLWLYQAVLSGFWKCLAGHLLRGPNAFNQELDWLSLVGELSGHWKKLRMGGGASNSC